MNVQFKSIKLKYFLPLAIFIILCGASILFLLLILLEKTPDNNFIIMFLKGLIFRYRSGIALSGIVIGIILLLLMKFIIKLFIIEYSIELNNNDIEIKSKNNIISLYYCKIKNIIIWNNTDYAKIIFETETLNYNYNIGFTKLDIFNKKRYQIIEDFNEIDKILFNNNFIKVIENNKGIEKIKYENKNWFPGSFAGTGQKKA